MMSNDKVRAFLESNGFGAYAEAFLEFGVLSVHDLMEPGIIGVEDLSTDINMVPADVAR